MSSCNIKITLQRTLFQHFMNFAEFFFNQSKILAHVYICLYQSIKPQSNFNKHSQNKKMSSLIHSKPHRLTKLLQIKYPILSAPMAATASGKLAGSVSKAGGLGMIGGGYLDQHKDMKLWIQEQFQEAEKITNGTLPIGIGFISWCLIKQPDLLLYSLELN